MPGLLQDDLEHLQSLFLCTAGSNLLSSVGGENDAILQTVGLVMNRNPEHKIQFRKSDSVPSVMATTFSSLTTTAHHEDHQKAAQSYRSVQVLGYG